MSFFPADLKSFLSHLLNVEERLYMENRRYGSILANASLDLVHWEKIVKIDFTIGNGKFYSLDKTHG